MRILILVAIASQTAAFIFSIFGLNCTSIGLQRPDLKYRLVRQNSSKKKTFDVVFNLENVVFDVENVVFDVENVVSKKIF